MKNPVSLQQDSEASAPVHDEVPRLPLSIGSLREDSDHNGSACSTVDCVFHVDLLEAANGNR